MAEVAVLHPQDLFKHHNNSLIPQAVRSRRYNNRPSSSSTRRKKSPAKKDTSPAKETTKPKPTPTPTPTPRPRPISPSITNNNSLVMGQFKLLKRGETLPLPLSSSPPSAKVDLMPPNKHQHQHVQKTKQATQGKKKIGSLIAGVSEELFPKQIRFLDSNCYAGSAIDSSPPPSSLPVPAFFKKKNLVFGDDRSNSSSTDDATSDLLKILRLDLS